MSLGNTNNVVSVDMATALELPLGVENERKFIALRNLHLRKIKQLMSSLDNKEREIAKLNILNKDNRRSQMIQALKNKIRDLELINDYMKEELVKKSDGLSLEEINKMIIRKTLSGPKRFRPLTREELENKIYELEKKLNKKGGGNNNGNYHSGGGDNMYQEQEQKMKGDMYDSQLKSPNNTNARPRDDEKGAPPTSTALTTSNNPNEFFDEFSLFDEVQSLRTKLTAKDHTINNLKDEINRLKSSNIELSTIKEDMESLEKQCEELKEYNHSLSDIYDETMEKLANTLESMNLMKTDYTLKLDANKSELQLLTNNMDKLVKQNTILVNKLTDCEELINKYEKDTLRKNNEINSNENTIQSKEKKIQQLEEKLLQLEDKHHLFIKESESKEKEWNEIQTTLTNKVNKSDDLNKQLEEKCQSLEEECKEIPILKGQLNNAEEKGIQLQGKCESLLKELDEIPILKKQLNEAEEKIQQLEEKCQSLEEQLKEIPILKKKLLQSENEVKELDGKYTTLEKEFQSLESESRSLQSQCQLLKTQLNEIPLLKNQLNEKNNEINELKDHLQERESLIVTLKRGDSRARLDGADPANLKKADSKASIDLRSEGSSSALLRKSESKVSVDPRSEAPNPSNLKKADSKASIDLRSEPSDPALLRKSESKASVLSAAPADPALLRKSESKVSVDPRTEAPDPANLRKSESKLSVDLRSDVSESELNIIAERKPRENYSSPAK